ncbi:hypothetical protein D3C81_2105920 [compost metagenome]
MIGNINVQIEQRGNHTLAAFRQLAAEAARFMESLLDTGAIRALQQLNEGRNLLIPVFQKPQHHCTVIQQNVAPDNRITGGNPGNIPESPCSQCTVQRIL